MNYSIKNHSLLRKILWADFALGASCGLAGLLLCGTLVPVLGLGYELIFWISLITLLYSLVAFRLVSVKSIHIPLLRALIAANWAWTLVSLGFIYFHFSAASLLGQIWLILQILIVGGLAYLEGKQLEKIR